MSPVYRLEVKLKDINKVPSRVLLADGLLPFIGSSLGIIHDKKHPVVEILTKDIDPYNLAQTVRMINTLKGVKEVTILERDGEPLLRSGKGKER